jgi:non-specific protein-tyrosine kinase
MELRQYAILLWRWAWLIVLATALAAGAAYLTSSYQTPIYEASTSLLIDQAPSTQTSEYTSLLMDERLARTYAELITDRLILEETARRLVDGVDIGLLDKSITVELVRETQLIGVSVEYPSAVMAAQITNTLVEVFIEQNSEFQASRFESSKLNLSDQLVKLDKQIEEKEAAIEALGTARTAEEKEELARLESLLSQDRSSYTALLQSYEELRLAEAQSASNVVQLAPATIPTSPIRPRILMNTLLAGVVGAMLALGVIFLIEYLDDTVKSTEEASQATGLPIIGFMAQVKDQGEGIPYVSQEPRAPFAEAFRALRSNIQFAGVDRGIRTLLVTSVGPEEGKTTVAANLAVVMAQGGKSVVLLDADLRKPRIHRMMGIPNRLGLSDIFVRPSAELVGMIRKWDRENLYIVPSGKLPPNPAELLASERMSQILDNFKGNYDFVIVDSPPVGVVTDPVVLSARMDATLLVIEPKKTKLAGAVQAVEQLNRAGANLIGLVFNNVPLKRTGYYTGYYSGYYYYQYAYSYADGKDGKSATTARPKKRKERERGKVGQEI